MTDTPNNFTDRCARFVDGEMTHEEENRLLADCENNPEQYRKLALGLVERQRIGKLLAEFQDVNFVTESAPVPISKTVYPMQAEKKRSVAGMTSWLATLAASLLLGIAVGVGAGGIEFNALLDSIGTAETRPVESQATVADRGDAEREPNDNQVPSAALADSLPIGDVGGDERFEDSLANQETLVSLARELKPTPTLDDQTVRTLLDSGVKVERHNHVFLFDISDGQQLAIPAEFTVLRSSSR